MSKWRLVPVEPTTLQSFAMTKADIEGGSRYDAMLAAAPAPTEWLTRAYLLIGNLERAARELPSDDDELHAIRHVLQLHLASVAPQGKPPT